MHLFFWFDPFYRLGQKSLQNFVCFLEDLQQRKIAFEINWPLKANVIYLLINAQRHVSIVRTIQLLPLLLRLLLMKLPLKHPRGTVKLWNVLKFLIAIIIHTDVDLKKKPCIGIKNVWSKMISYASTMVNWNCSLCI